MSNNRKRTRQKFLVMRRNLTRAIIRKRIKEAVKKAFKSRQEILIAFGNIAETAKKVAIEFSILHKCFGGKQ